MCLYYIVINVTMSFGVLNLNYASFEQSSHPPDHNDEYIQMCRYSWYI